MNTRVASVFNALNVQVLGVERPVELLLTGLLARGHVLIEGPPGCGKTSLASALAQAIGCTFRRIQFTPDTLPADVVGFSILDPDTGQFVFRRGAVFGHIVLADELNRTGPRVQSALLECMSEQQVTVDGTTHPLEPPFCVVATQNVHEAHGTFPLPDSQLDRFLISFAMETPPAGTQIEILQLHAAGLAHPPTSPSATRAELLSAIDDVERVPISRQVLAYVVAVCEAVRKHSELRGLVSTRTSIALMRAARASAFIHADTAVYPDHVKHVATHVFRHRLLAHGGRRCEDARVAEILRHVLAATPVPLSCEQDDDATSA